MPAPEAYVMFPELLRRLQLGPREGVKQTDLIKQLNISRIMVRRLIEHGVEYGLLEMTTVKEVIRGGNGALIPRSLVAVKLAAGGGEVPGGLPKRTLTLTRMSLMCVRLLRTPRPVEDLFYELEMFEKIRSAREVRETAESLSSVLTSYWKDGMLPTNVVGGQEVVQLRLSPTYYQKAINPFTADNLEALLLKEMEKIRLVEIERKKEQLINTLKRQKDRHRRTVQRRQERLKRLISPSTPNPAKKGQTFPPSESRSAVPDICSIKFI